MFRNFILLLALVGCKMASGQTFEWVNHANVNYTMNPSYPDFAVALDEVNNKVFSSHLVNSVQIYGQEIYGEQLIDCRDLSGNLLWSYPMGIKATANKLQVDANGDLIVCGNFMDTLHLGTTDFLANTSGAPFSTNTFILKLDGNGNLVWKRNLTPTWPMIQGVNATALDPSGFVWYAYTDFFEAKIVQTDAAGNDQLIHSITNAKSIGNISFDPWGGLYISGGAESGFFIMDGVTFFTADQYNMFVARFEPDGDPHWVTFAHDITFQKPVVVADAFGSAYVTGTICDSTSFGSVHFHTPNMMCDFFVTKTDSVGNFQWGLAQPPLLIGPFGQFEMGSNLHAGTDASGNLYFTGVHRGTVDWGGSFTSSTASFTDRKMSVVKVNPSGQAQWVKIGGSADVNYPHSLAVAQNGDCYFTGFAGDSAVFDTIQINTANFRNYIIGKISVIATSIPEQEPLTATPFYNQGNGVLVVGEDWLGASLDIYDTRGVLVKRIASVENPSTDFSGLPNGLYLIRMEKDGTAAAGKWLHAIR